jgi:hypothetical protein
MPDRAAPMKRSGFARTPPTPLERSVTPGLRSSGLTRHRPTKARLRANQGVRDPELRFSRAVRRGKPSVACGTAWRSPTSNWSTASRTTGEAAQSSQRVGTVTHTSCHSRIEQAARHEGYENGWLVRHGSKLADEPVLIGARRVLLDDLGTYQDYQEARHAG